MQKDTTSIKPRIYFLGRLIALVIALLILIILGLILLKNKNASTIIQSIKSYKTIERFQKTHVSGNELSLVYLAPEKDQPETCISICLETKNCVASNYYKGNSSKNQGGQCWLFEKIDPAKLSFTEECCELAIVSAQKESLDLVRKLAPKRNN